MNIKKQYSIREFGTPSVFSGTNILTIKDGYWYINGQLTSVQANNEAPQSSTNIHPNLNNELGFFEGADKSIFQKNLELLNQRINAVHKQLTYWDLYKITTALRDPQDFESAFAALTVGSSLVINCPSFNKGNIEYSRGDIIVKTAQDEEIKIDALNTGLFFPELIEHIGSTNTYTLKYTYSNKIVGTEGTMVEIGSTVPETDLLYKDISFTGFSDVSANIYGIRADMSSTSSLTFNLVYNENASSPVLPIVKFFNQENEEISLDIGTATTSHASIVISSEHSTVTVELNNASVVKYIQVK